MIKNIIFDLGNVLVEFTWERVLRDLGIVGADCEAVVAAMFRSPVWDEFDRGAWSDEKILDAFIQNAPAQEENIRRVFAQVPNMIHKYSYTDEWIRELKHKGYACFVLSNYGKSSFEQTQGELGFLKEMDGAVISYQWEVVKPYPQIYQILLQEYGLDPKECVFLDDKEINVEGARKLGMYGIQFLSKEQAVEELEQLGVR